MSGRAGGLTRDVIETRILRVLWWVGVIFFLGFTIIPFIYMLMLSIRTIESIAADPGALIPPLESISFETYVEVLKSVQEGGQGFLVFLRNSAIIATVAVIVSLLVAIPGAYAVARSASSAVARSARCSSRSISSRRSCSRSRCS